MTEEEKIFAGRLFDARTKELRDIKHKAHITCQKFNLLDEYDENRQPLIRKFIGRIGQKYYFQGPVQFNYGCHTFIGENFFANFNFTVMDDGRIYIGDNVMIGPNVSLMATSHPLIPEERLAMLEPFSYVTLVGEASNADVAAEKIRELKPDLILLDIYMPGRDGFELLESLDEVPEVIFTTAFDEYAVQAFDYNALAYLVKPIDQRDLTRALSRAYEKISSSRPPERNGTYLSEKDRIFVKDGERCWFVRLGDIRYFESVGNYVRIHFDSYRPLILKSLNSVDCRLDPKVFFRANRGCIFNLKLIESIAPSSGGGLTVSLSGGDTVEISRRQTQKFKDMMSL